MIINVTQRHIDTGLQGECDKCPVALALFGAGCDSVTVGHFEMSFLYKGEHYELDNPVKVASFVANFDTDEPVSPFSFELPLV